MFAEHGSEGRTGTHTSLDLLHLLPNKVGSSLRASLEARGAHSRQDAFTQVSAETSVTPRPLPPCGVLTMLTPHHLEAQHRAQGPVAPGPTVFAELSMG